MPHGPRSLILMVSERPLCGLVTVSVVPSGHVRAAAVFPFASKRSPFAVRFPEEYMLARTYCPEPFPERFTYLWTEPQPAACAEATVNRPITSAMPICFIESPLQ